MLTPRVYCIRDKCSPFFAQQQNIRFCKPSFRGDLILGRHSNFRCWKKLLCSGRQGDQSDQNFTNWVVFGNKPLWFIFRHFLSLYLTGWLFDLIEIFVCLDTLIFRSCRKISDRDGFKVPLNELKIFLKQIFDLLCQCQTFDEITWFHF